MSEQLQEHLSLAQSGRSGQQGLDAEDLSPPEALGERTNTTVELG